MTFFVVDIMAIHHDVRVASIQIIPDVPYVKKGTNLCRLPNGLRCMGCCGMDYLKSGATKQDFIAAMKQSAEEFKQFKTPLEYKKRVAANDLHDCGQCR